jgi:plastocyanin
VRRVVAPAVALGAFLFLAVPPAAASLHEVTVANYYFQDDTTGARKTITVDQGDQIRFTVRQAAYPPHSVVIDEYGIDSGYLLLFDTYTTPPLNKPGTFLLYCRAHRARGHYATLVVKAKPGPGSPAPGPVPGASGAHVGGAKKPGSPVAGASTPAKPGSKPTAVGSTPGATAEPVVPSGVGTSSDRRRATPDASSLAGVLGRSFGGDVPWTSALWLSLIAGVGVAAVAGLAISRERRRELAGLAIGATVSNDPTNAKSSAKRPR